MPGKPFRSGLEPHFLEIGQRRARRETWAEIAAELERVHGLKVHFSAVQKFFARFQARRVQPLGFAPLAAVGSAEEAAAATQPPATGTPPAKKYVFIPKPKRESIFSEEDLQWNDPLA